MKKLTSLGNRKIGQDTIIFNMNAAMDCPSEKLGLCKIAHKCYAKKAERMYPQVLPFRRRQEQFWDQVTADQFVTDLLDTYGKKINAGMIKFLRVSEAGDFKGQSDVDKLSKIASLLEGKVKVYTYTARLDLDYSDIDSNLTINFSSGGEVSTHFWTYGNTFTPIQKGTFERTHRKQVLCKADCSRCHLCKLTTGLDIQVEIH